MSIENPDENPDENLGIWDGIVRRFRNSADLINAIEQRTGHYVIHHPDTAALEDGLSHGFGMPTLVTTRGETAITTALFAFGNTIACSRAIYPGTLLQLLEYEKRDWIKILWFDPTVSTDILRAAENADTIFVETIGNSPTMPVANIAELLDITIHNNCMLVVDNTATPHYFLKPQPNLIIVSSFTKYDQPGNDQMGGRISATKKAIAQIAATSCYTNSAMLPDVAHYFSYHATDTLTRFGAHSINAQRIADLCQKHKAVEQVWYPGLPSHPGHSLAQAQFDGAFGGLLFIKMRSEKTAIDLCDRLAANDTNGCDLSVGFGDENLLLVPLAGKKLYTFAGNRKGMVRIASGRHDPANFIDGFHHALNSLA